MEKVEISFLSSEMKTRHVIYEYTCKIIFLQVPVEMNVILELLWRKHKNLVEPMCGCDILKPCGVLSSPS